ncbi:hypothetical protein MN116_003670 [Schistosoma mekongi]|uniref:Uncharacterized protein n=1 Tax=Schistosoma mekongi TaxID=38744 RepID=A0AAE1ZF86_SCHME|nr:hypothetical protein MN116_003670 [Schistosoma mekongi]
MFVALLLFILACSILNKTTRPVALVDSSWPYTSQNDDTFIFSSSIKDDNNDPVEYEQEIKNTLHNGLEQAAESEASERLRCYRRQLLMSLSSRLQLPLVTITDLEECPGSMIDSAIKWFSFSKSKHRSGNSHQRISNPYSPALVHSIGPSQFLVAELLKNLIVLNEEIWKGFAIVYEHSGDFLKYRECLESLQTTALIRRWRDNSFYKAHIIREIKHLEAFFLDLSAKSIEQFFQMASFISFLSFTKYMGDQEVNPNYVQYFIFNDGSFEGLMNSLQRVKGNIALVRFKIPGTSHELQSESLHTQMIRSIIEHLSAAMNLAGNKLQVPEHVTCTPVRSSLLKTPKGLLVSHKNGPHITYKNGQLLHTYINQVLHSRIGYIDSNKINPILDYGLELIHLKNGRLEQLADWSLKRGFVYKQPSGSSFPQSGTKYMNKTFIVTTIEDPPFVIFEPYRQGVHLEGNDQWTGFAMELLQHLSKMNHFDYIIKPVSDKKFGTFDESKGKWDGLIGDLVYKKADLAVASFTITYDRERVIDFTTPFMSLSLSVIIQKSNSDPGLQFTAPLSNEVWISVGIAYFVVSLTLFLIGRASPYEWYARHPCYPIIQNQFTMRNSFWFTAGSLMQQSSDIVPRATSTRIIGGIWWFFILVITSSYTANLAAFLTIDRMQADIESVEDLARQTKIKYGTIHGGSTYSFFKNSDIPTYQRMWNFMNQNKSLFVNKTEEGIARVLEGGYALILESTLNEYYAQRNCKLTPLGGLLDPRGYGIGLPIGNNGLRDLLSESILKLQKDQTLEKMRQYWLQRYNASVPCYLQSSHTNLPSRSKLTLTKMSSAFIGLGVGLFFGILVWITEIVVWVLKVRTNANNCPIKEIGEHFQKTLCDHHHATIREVTASRRNSVDGSLLKQHKDTCKMNNINNTTVTHNTNINSNQLNNASTFHKVTSL